MWINAWRNIFLQCASFAFNVRPLHLDTPAYKVPRIRVIIPLYSSLITLNYIKVMYISDIADLLDKEPGLSRTLGMTFVSTPEPDTCVATLAVDGRTRQPFGVLSGGATLALAETLAGVGSLALCPGEKYVGVNVSGSHVKAVKEGDTITAVARILHRGRRFHVWHVEVTNTAGEIISTVTVTNYAVLIKPREE